jgi:hypothetical protein
LWTEEFVWWADNLWSILFSPCLSHITFIPETKPFFYSPDVDFCKIVVSKFLTNWNPAAILNLFYVIFEK